MLVPLRETGAKPFSGPCAAVLMTVFSVCADFGIAEPSPGRGAYKACDRAGFLGRSALHSNLSPDAYIFENRMLGPSEAYQFAAGESVLSSTGTLAKLDRPLDFLRSRIMPSIWAFSRPSRLWRVPARQQNTFNNVFSAVRLPLGKVHGG